MNNKTIITIIAVIFWISLILGIVFFVVKPKNNSKTETKVVEETVKEEVKTEEPEQEIKEEVVSSVQGERRRQNYDKYKKLFLDNKQWVFIDKNQYDILFDTIIKRNQDWNLNSKERGFHVDDFVSKSFLSEYNEKDGILSDFIPEEAEARLEDYDIYDNWFKVYICLDGLWEDNSNYCEMLYKFSLVEEDKIYKIDDIRLIYDTKINNPLESVDRIINVVWDLYNNSDRNKTIQRCGTEFFEKYPDGLFLGNIQNIYEISEYVQNGISKSDIDQYSNIKIKTFDKEKNKFLWTYYIIYYELNANNEISDMKGKMIRKAYETVNSDNSGPFDISAMIGDTDE